LNTRAAPPVKPAPSAPLLKRLAPTLAKLIVCGNAVALVVVALTWASAQLPPACSGTTTMTSWAWKPQGSRATWMLVPLV
jgi:hypothetical protein